MADELEKFFADLTIR
jgi:hypothetical protein